MLIYHSHDSEAIDGKKCILSVGYFFGFSLGFWLGF